MTAFSTSHIDFKQWRDPPARPSRQIPTGVTVEQISILLALDGNRSSWRIIGGYQSLGMPRSGLLRSPIPQDLDLALSDGEEVSPQMTPLVKGASHVKRKAVWMPLGSWS